MAFDLVLVLRLAAQSPPVQPFPRWVEYTARLAPVVLAGVALLWFVAQRAYARNLHVACKARLARAGANGLLTIEVKATNAGKVAVPIDRKGTLVRVETLASSDSTWTHYGSRHIFEEHDLLNPGEVISTEVVTFTRVPLPLSMRIEVAVRSGSSWWRTSVVVAAEEEKGT